MVAQSRLELVCTVCVHVLKRIGNSVFLTLSGVVIHSGRHRVDFKKETPFITFMWSSLPPEMTMELWKQPFVCSVIWADFKASFGYVIATYLEFCLERFLLQWIRLKMGWKSALFYNGIFLWMKTLVFNCHQSLKYYFWAAEIILQLKSYTEDRRKSLSCYFLLCS